MSCKSRKITASRSSGDSFCSASCTIFWVCLLCACCLGTGRLVFQLLSHRQAVFLTAWSGLQRVRNPVVFALAEVVYQQVARDRRDPRHEGRTSAVERIQRPINLDEYFLGKVGGIVGRTREAVADVVNAPVILLDDLLPSCGISGYTSPDQRVDRLVVVQTVLPKGSDRP